MTTQPSLPFEQEPPKVKRPGFHFTKIENSKPLQRVLALLKDHIEDGVTGMEILRHANVLNPATVISHLRHNGCQIDCRYQGKSESGAQVYRYWLIEKIKCEAVR